MVLFQVLSRVQLFATPWTVTIRLLYLWAFLGKSTGVSCYFLFQGIFPTQGSNPRLLHWQTSSLPLSHQGSYILSLLVICVLWSLKWCLLYLSIVKVYLFLLWLSNTIVCGGDTLISYKYSILNNILYLVILESFVSLGQISF